MSKYHGPTIRRDACILPSLTATLRPVSTAKTALGYPRFQRTKHVEQRPIGRQEILPRPCPRTAPRDSSSSLPSSCGVCSAKPPTPYEVLRACCRQRLKGETYAYPATNRFPRAYIFNQPQDCYGFAPGAAYFSSRPLPVAFSSARPASALDKAWSALIIQTYKPATAFLNSCENLNAEASVPIVSVLTNYRTHNPRPARIPLLFRCRWRHCQLPLSTLSTAPQDATYYAEKQM